MDRKELIDTLILYEAPHLSHRDVARVVLQAGSATAVFSTPRAVLRNWGLKDATIRHIESHAVSDDIKTQIEFIEKHSIATISYNDEGYPSLLRMCEDAPLMLYGRGDIDFTIDRPVISIVGTRNITPYGAAAVEEIVAALSGYRPMIVSGLAAGVDVHAHRAALKHNLPTVGVLGQGLGTPLFPSSNKDTAREMCSTPSCGIVTEYNHLMAPLPGLFPARNRIVAGMSIATIVIEAKAKGGALITARLASGYNREVFALPGRMSDPCSAGCNALIRDNKAIIIDSPQTIIDELSLSMEREVKMREENNQTILFPELDSQEQKIVEVLRPHEKLHLDELSVMLGLAPFELAGVLLSMELKGYIETQMGKYYALTPSMRA
ncbi:MAG: DNA-processing protein DprA [Flavobacteriales bacterium]|jgi:DNA processing protein|nr:DNA-processing protein DprA [Flavobacteriales bacterium]